MNRGRQSARSEDNSNVRSTIQHFYNFKQPLPVQQVERGFHHPECMFLLAPVNIDLNDAEVEAEEVDDYDEIEYMPPKMQGQLTQYIPFSD